MEIHGPTSHIFFSQRLRMHYVDWGNTDAPPLLMVHGAQDHCRNWDWMAQELRKDWHVIAVDLRGHGDSAWSTDGYYSMDAFLCDLSQLIEQRNLAPLTVIAHSMGGLISLRYAAIFPENIKKLVLIEGIGLNNDYIDQQYNMPYIQKMRDWIEYRRSLADRKPRAYGSIEEAYQRMQEQNKHLSEAQARHLTIHGVNQNEDGSFSWKFDNYGRRHIPSTVSEEGLHRLYAEIQCPTMIAWGRESPFTDPAENGRLEHFKHATMHYYDAGHWLHHDQFDQFLADVRDFI